MHVYSMLYNVDISGWQRLLISPHTAAKLNPTSSAGEYPRALVPARQVPAWADDGLSKCDSLAQGDGLMVKEKKNCILEF